MSPPPPAPIGESSKTHRSGEWSALREDIDRAVRDALTKALKEDSGFLRGTDTEDEHRAEMRKLVHEMRSSLITSAGDLRQNLLDVIGNNATELRAMVREEVTTLRVQIVGLAGSIQGFQDALGEIRDELHQGDTNFAVLDTRLVSLKEEMNHVRSGTPAGSLAHNLEPVRLPNDYVPHRSRRDSTDRTSKKSSKDDDEKPLISNKVWNAILIGILSTIGTGIGTYILSLNFRSPSDVAKNVTAPTLPKPPDHAPSPSAPSPSAP